jgi:HlyD family secretion protein
MVNDSLIEKRIIIGLNDDTHVQVLHGLTTDDEVVDGIQNPATPPAASSGATKSPFMPQRRNNPAPKKPPQSN